MLQLLPSVFRNSRTAVCFLIEQLGAARSWIEVLWKAPQLPRSAGSAADAELPPCIAFRCLEPGLRGLGCGHGGAGGQSMLHCHGASSALVDAHWFTGFWSASYVVPVPPPGRVSGPNYSWLDSL